MISLSINYSNLINWYWKIIAIKFAVDVNANPSKSNPPSEKEEESIQSVPTPEKVRLAPVISEDDKVQSSPKEGTLTNGVIETEKVPSEMEDSSSDSESAEEEQPDAELQVEDQNEVWI